MLRSKEGSLSPGVIREAQQKYGNFSTFVVQDDALYQEIESALTARRGLADMGPTFLALFEAEVSRITDYVIGQHECQERCAKALLVNAFTLIDDSDTGRRTNTNLLEGLRYQANEQLQSCLKLRRFTKDNAATLTEVAQYADSKLSMTCSILWHHQQRQFPASDSALIVIFSDIYATLHSAETKQQKVQDEEWVAPSSFERTTTKYWVEEESLAEVLLLASAEAPLLVYGRNGCHTTKADCLLQRSEGNKLWDSLVTPISSVYFESTCMDLYNARIAREEGSQLLRARWYGDKPEGKEPLFLELKTHHEKWINSKSVKERVTIQAQDMETFLSPNMWTYEDALALVVPANPTLSGSKLEHTTALLLTMHALVVKLRLYACVRSVYKRAAFQSAQSNSLRLTIDRGVALINEQMRACDESWCLSDNGTAATGPHMVKRVPYAIFEVKLSGSEMPDAIRRLEEERVIIKAEKFSKFLTGVAFFNADKLEKLPYWTDYPAFSPLFKTPSKVPTSNIDVTQSSTFSRTENKIIPTSEKTKQGSIIPESCRSRKGLGIFSRESYMHGTPARVIVAKTSVRVEPKTFFANERTFIQWISGALLLVTVSAIILDFQSHIGASLTVGFALVVSAAIIVCYATFVYFRRLKLLTSGSPYGYIDRIGPVLLAGSVLIGVVLLLFYFFHETSGDNTALNGMLQRTAIQSEPGFCTQRTLQGISLLEYQPSDVLVDRKRNLLLVPSLSRITGLSTDSSVNEPLDVFADVEGADLEALTYVGDRLFAVSEGSKSSTLVELEWNNMDDLLGQVQELKLPTPNVEGIAFVPAAENETEGRLYVAGSRRVDTGASFGIVDVYRVPKVLAEQDVSLDEVNELSPSRRLNNNLLNQGLTDSKISALCYFEGILYILHDNAQVVRAWDIDQGKLLSEWRLPHVAGGFEKQWEGLALERREVVGVQQEAVAAGKDFSQLILHLSLDSPPEIWSLTVQEGLAKGTLILPNCAAAATTPH